MEVKAELDAEEVKTKEWAEKLTEKIENINAILESKSSVSKSKVDEMNTKLKNTQDAILQA